MSLYNPPSPSIKLKIAYEKGHCVLPIRSITSYTKAPGEFTRVEAYVDGKLERYLVTVTPDEIQHSITSRLGWEISNG